MVTDQQKERPVSHLAPIAAVAIGPSGAVFTGSYDGFLRQWEPISSTLKSTSRFLLHSKGINCIAVDPNGERLATGGSDGRACLIDLANPTNRVLVLDHPGDVETILFSADGQRLLTGGTDGTARIFDARTGEQLFVVEHRKTVGASSRHVDNRFVLTGCNDCSVRKIEWSTGRVAKEQKAHSGPVKALVSTTHGIVSAGHDSRVLLLSDDDLRVVGEVAKFSTTPKSMCTEPGGRYFWIAAYDQTVTRWRSDDLLDLAKRQAKPVSHIHDARVWSHGVASVEGMVVVGSFDGAPQCFRDEGEQRYSNLRLEGNEVPCISSMVLDHGRACLVAGGDSGVIRQVKVADLKPNGRQGMRDVVAIAPSAITGVQGDASDVVYGCWDGTLERFSDGGVRWTAQWPHEQSLRRHAHAPIVGIARSDKYVLAGLYTGGAICFSADDGRYLWSQPEATGAVKSVSIASDLFALTGRYDPLRVGLVADGMIGGRLDLRTPVSDVVELNAVGTRLAVCGGSSQVWIVGIDRTKTGPEIGLEVLHRGEGHTAPVKAIAWLDEETVISGCYNGHLFVHRLGKPSIRISQVDSRLGVSAIAIDRDLIYWTTFDGYVGSCPRELFADL